MAKRTPAPSRLDRLGDPLLRHALMRLGTNRLRPPYSLGAKLAWSSDGKWIAAGGIGRELYVYDARTGAQHAQLMLPACIAADAVALSGDGSRLAALYSPGPRQLKRIALFDVTTGKAIAVEPTYADNLAFSPDGSCLAASNSGAHPIAVFNARSGALLQHIESKGAGANNDSLAFSPDRQLLLTVNWMGARSLILWDWKRKKRVCECTIGGERDGDGTAVAVTDRHIVTACNAGRFTWDWRGKLVERKPAPSDVARWWRAITPDGTLAALSDSDASSKVVYRVADGVEVTRVTAAASAGSALGPTGALAVRDHNAIVVYEPGGAPRFDRLDGLEAAPWSLAFTADQLVTCAHDDEGVRRFSLDGQPLPITPADQTLVGAQLDRQGRWALAFHAPKASTEKAVRQHDLATGRVRAQLSCDKPVSSSALSPDGTLVAIAEAEAVRVVNLASGKLLHTLPATKIRALAFSDDGQLLAGASQEARAAYVWRVAGGSLIQGSASQYGSSVAFSSDGKLLLVVSKQLVELHRVVVGRKDIALSPLHSLKWKEAFSGTVHPDGRLFAVLDGAGTSVCDVETGKVRVRLPGQTAGGQRGNHGGPWFSPDGKRLFTSDLCAVLAWDLESLLAG